MIRFRKAQRVIIMNKAFLIGESIYLRPAEPDDAPTFAACINDPVVRHSYFTHTPVSITAQTKKIASFYEGGSDYIPFVIVRKDNDRAIGTTALHRVDLVSGAAIFGICICDEASRGMGFGSETTKLMLHYAFDILNMHRIQLHVWVGNARGISAYTKAGFKKEGTLREAMKHNGEYCDFHVMGILEDEYRTLQKKKKAD